MDEAKEDVKQMIINSDYVHDSEKFHILRCQLTDKFIENVANGTLKDGEIVKVAKYIYDTVIYSDPEPRWYDK
jgi:hypothetical protein